MPENIFWNNSPVLEAEIAELSRQIEAKRKQLEVENGIVSDQEIVAQTVAESFTTLALEQSTTSEQVGVDVTPASVSTSLPPSATYLDTLDEESVVTLNTLIAMVPEQGVGKAIRVAASHGPFMLDAFHDALVDRLYAELQTRGLVK
jgi:hypothetical protein